MTGMPENHTLYINNLNDRKNCELLKQELQRVCSAYGDIHDIICMKSLKRRGQAWVVFKSIASAREAKERLQDYPLFDKPMRVDFARTKSDVISKEDGTFVPRPKNTLKQDPTKRDAEKKKAEAQQAAKEAAAAAAPSGVQPGQMGAMNFRPGMPAVAGSTPAFFQVPTMPMLQPQLGSMYPNETLFVQNLPKQATENLLRLLFQQYPGFKEVRYIDSRNCAFVDYSTTPHATHAMHALATLEIQPGLRMNISYARK
ncbi:unnamed protein product [Amoebophrya sp. A25]|nr:unnamed protein product [Amoebophrya sp. A25]|eukprot:GSA25T00018322001.1